MPEQALSHYKNVNYCGNKTLGLVLLSPENMTMTGISLMAAVENFEPNSRERNELI